MRIKEIIIIRRRRITHYHLVHKRTVNHLAKLANVTERGFTMKRVREANLKKLFVSYPPVG